MWFLSHTICRFYFYCFQLVFFFFIKKKEKKYLNPHRMLAWCTNKKQTNGNYIFAVSLNRVLFFFPFRKERKKNQSRDFSGRELIAHRFFFFSVPVDFLPPVRLLKRQPTPRVGYAGFKCHSLRIIYSSDQKHKCKPEVVPRRVRPHNPFLLNTTQGSSLDLNPDPPKPPPPPAAPKGMTYPGDM